MVEIPTKNAAAYRSVFERLAGLARKYNDVPGVDEDPNPDQFVLDSTSKSLYSSGDKSSYRAELTQGEVSRLHVEVSGKRGPYKAELNLEKTATGLNGRETLRSPNGVTERSFVIEGDKVTLLNQTNDPTPYRLPVPPDSGQAGQELTRATDELQYLLAPNF